VVVLHGGGSLYRKVSSSENRAAGSLKPRKHGGIIPLAGVVFTTLPAAHAEDTGAEPRYKKTAITDGCGSGLRGDFRLHCGQRTAVGRAMSILFFQLVDYLRFQAACLIFGVILTR